MSKGRLRICDDETQRALLWKRQLEGLPAVADFFDVITVDEPELLDAVATLEQRRQDARSNKFHEKGSFFDDTDLLIVDYDLVYLSSGQFLTGEGLAYLARSYSKCGPIIALNQFGDNWFDLSLRWHPESFADVNVGSTQLANFGLWCEPFKGFRPWAWPLMGKLVQDFGFRVSKVLENLDQPILATLGLGPEIIPAWSRIAAEFLVASTDNLHAVTFREFVNASGSGLRPKDLSVNDEQTARIAAARVSAWLERIVLPEGDILVDAPGLAERFPSLVVGEPAADAFNSIATFDEARLEKSFHLAVLESARVIDPKWLSRPAWAWPLVAANSAISEVSDPWSTERSGLSFCEDVSRFLPAERTREFVADVESAYSRRSVVDPFADDNDEFADLKQIEYRPRVRFSL